MTSFSSTGALSNDAGEEVLDARQLPADRVDGGEVVLVHADDGRTRVRDDVGEIVRREAIVDWYERRADLRHGVERFELRVRVRRDVRHTVAGADAEPLQRRRPPVAALEELGIGQPQIAVDERLAVRIQRARPARELERRQGYEHKNLNGAAGPTRPAPALSLRARRSLRLLSEGNQVGEQLIRAIGAGRQLTPEDEADVNPFPLAIQR